MAAVRANTLTIDRIWALARILWDYNYVPMPPGDADALIVMGTDDLGVPRHAAELARAYRYKCIVVTGGVRHELAKCGAPFGDTEAEIFRRVMIEAGCPNRAILLETSARNTGANVLESKALLERQGIAVCTGQLIHTPTMQRRALATAEKQWPEVKWRISGQLTTFENYVVGLDFERFVHGLVGDTYRIWRYPSLGFQTEQLMPSEVREALRSLLTLGFVRTLRDGYSLEDV